jgi:hypothetical protein
LNALEQSGKLGGASEALVQVVRSLADSVDRDPQNASLWREYRGAVSDLLKLGADDGDAFTDLVTRLRSPVGDAPN